MLIVRGLEDEVQGVMGSLGVSVVHLMPRAGQRVLGVESVPGVLLLCQVGGYTVHFVGLLVNRPAIEFRGYLRSKKDWEDMQSFPLTSTCIQCEPADSITPIHEKWCVVIHYSPKITQNL